MGLSQRTVVPLGTRGLCYSPGWRLLALAAGPAVLLHDMREPGRPALRVAMPDGSHVGSVHIDHGGDRWGGHLVVSTSSSRVRIFDVRRAAAAGALPDLGCLAPKLPHRLPPCACLHAHGSMLVVGGGAKSSGAFRLNLASDAAAGDDDENEQDGAQSQSTAPTSRSKAKPARLTKKQWSHESSGRGAGRRKA